MAQILSPTTITVPIQTVSTQDCNCLWIEEMHVNAKNPQLGDTPSASMVLRPYRQINPTDTPQFAGDDALIYWATEDLFAAATNLAGATYTSLAAAIQAIYTCTPDLLKYMNDRAADMATAQTALTAAQTAFDSANATLIAAGSGLKAAQMALNAALAATPPVPDTIAAAQAVLDGINAAVTAAQPAVTTAQAALTTAKTNLQTATAAWQDPANAI